MKRKKDYSSQNRVHLQCHKKINKKIISGQKDARAKGDKCRGWGRVEDASKGGNFAMCLSTKCALNMAEFSLKTYMVKSKLHGKVWLIMQHLYLSRCGGICMYPLLFCRIVKVIF